jgi:tetratricopeptide (TPR) repeat protein
LYKWALQEKKKKKDKADWMYGYEQALAAAYESSDDLEEVKKAMAMFTRLNETKSGRAMNVRGLARCYRRLGKNTEAMKQYDKLVGGLKHKSPQWWRAQLERLQFAIVALDSPEGLKSIRLQINRLSSKDPRMGGYWEPFNVIESNVSERLKKIGQKSN